MAHMAPQVFSLKQLVQSSLPQNQPPVLPCFHSHGISQSLSPARNVCISSDLEGRVFRIGKSAIYRTPLFVTGAGEPGRCKD